MAFGFGSSPEPRPLSLEMRYRGCLHHHVKPHERPTSPALGNGRRGFSPLYFSPSRYPTTRATIYFSTGTHKRKSRHQEGEEDNPPQTHSLRTIRTQFYTTHVVRLAVAVVSREAFLVVGHVETTVGGALHAAKHAVTAEGDMAHEKEKQATYIACQ